MVVVPPSPGHRSPEGESCSRLPTSRLSCPQKPFLMSDLLQLAHFPLLGRQSDTKTLVMRLCQIDSEYGHVELINAPAPAPTLANVQVLDLGSGSGRDCYLASALVGPEGQVTGVDMTREQLDVSTSTRSPAL